MGTAHKRNTGGKAARDQGISAGGDALLAELQAIDPGLAALADKPHHLTMQFTPEQDRAIVAARRAGIPWPKILTWWRGKYGKPPSEGTLLRRFRELEAK